MTGQADGTGIAPRGRTIPKEIDRELSPKARKFVERYDGEGNRTKRTKSPDLSYSEYTWDFRNRLTQIKDKTSAGTITKQVDYACDLFGRLIKKTIDNDGAGSGSPTSEWYVFDGYRDATGRGIRSSCVSTTLELW